MIDAPARVLALGSANAHYAPLIDQPGITIEIAGDFAIERIDADRCDLVITTGISWYQANQCLRRARELCIPSLVLIDGILEWRHQWTNPKHGAGEGLPFAMPILADKVACLGWADARLLESWDNVGKCEVVGIPRFDGYLTQPVGRPSHDGKRRVLIMSANTPAFTDAQMQQVERAFADLRDCLHDHPAWEPIWRVRGGIDQRLGLQDATHTCVKLPARGFRTGGCGHHHALDRPTGGDAGSAADGADRLH